MLSLPVVYLVWLFAAYDSAFMHVAFVPDAEVPPTWRVRVRCRVALLIAFRASVRDAGSFPGYAARGLRAASSLKEAVAVARAVRQERLDRESEEAAKAQRLVDFAGVDGEDGEGRRLDRREFAETRAALRWLATCHMGWYDRQNRYRNDLLDVVLDGDTTERYGLPADHGITMRVSKDGQRWYAARSTVTGWWFAIGASGPPPSQWEFDGAEPPQGFPDEDPAWRNDPFTVWPNWSD